MLGVFQVCQNVMHRMEETQDQRVTRVSSPIKGDPEAAGGVGQAIAEPCQLSVVRGLIQVVIEQLHEEPGQDCGLWRSIGLQGRRKIASETMYPPS